MPRSRDSSSKDVVDDSAVLETVGCLCASPQRLQELLERMREALPGVVSAPPRVSRRCPADRPARPMNAYFYFRSTYWHVESEKEEPISKDHRSISRIAGLIWNHVPQHERTPYKDAAREALLRHARAHPNYSYHPSSTSRSASKKAKARRAKKAADSDDAPYPRKARRVRAIVVKRESLSPTGFPQSPRLQYPSPSPSPSSSASRHSLKCPNPPATTTSVTPELDMSSVHSVSPVDEKNSTHVTPSDDQRLVYTPEPEMCLLSECSSLPPGLTVEADSELPYTGMDPCLGLDQDLPVAMPCTLSEMPTLSMPCDPMLPYNAPLPSTKTGSYELPSLQSLWIPSPGCDDSLSFAAGTPFEGSTMPSLDEFIHDDLTMSEVYDPFAFDTIDYFADVTGASSSSSDVYSEVP
ncbi:hypothetical protein FISHEDRAFT_54936 [Fistulina hepatica ATCC 64428]|uniref:HMG box domain-containing protein n=1 Tax=Fistulina hepatica ATCC 64428 TaxID=1128425 RepID=A0A0D7AQG7_9AGAR|nr:hypothetical protein FISHEDRAFT_54936 [Fistulina hepatica ATCC 64428]